MPGSASIKSDCCNALEQCIKDCFQLVAKIKDVPGMEKTIELTEICIGACADCLDACESVRLDRGRMMITCAEACKICALECEKHNSPESIRCAESCRKCVEELSHLLA